MKVVNKPIFDQYVDELRMKARLKRKLLKEKEIIISEEAEQLLAHIDDDETGYLYSNIKRAGESRKHDREISA